MQVMVKEGALPFSMNYKRNARIGVIPKRLQGVASKDVKVRWFELDQPLAIFHTVNAWQEGDSIHLFACIYDKVWCLFYVDWLEFVTPGVSSTAVGTRPVLWLSFTIVILAQVAQM